jgi:hypothetical protein
MGMLEVELMKFSRDLKGARLTLVRAAEVLEVEVGHLRRLIRRRVYPPPHRTEKNRPFVDYDWLVQVKEIRRTGIGHSGEEVMFYRPRKQASPRGRRRQPKHDAYVEQVIEGCRQLGLSSENLTPECTAALLIETFGDERPDLSVAIPAVARAIVKNETAE